MKSIFLYICLSICLIPTNSFAQKYWIFFQDKNIKQSSPALSADAIESRMRQNINLDARDFPVNQIYIEKLQEKGITILRKSRWLNAVTANLSPEQKTEIALLPFVKEVKSVQAMQLTKDAEISLDTLEVNRYDWQLKMIGLDVLHNMGLRGKGVRMAIFDNGFRKTNVNRGFTHVFQENRLKYTHDFVDNDSDVFADCGSEGACKHGSYCWSIIAGIIADSMQGTAPDADFYLFRTENDFSETHQEEDNWVVAAEVADSLGAQVFSTSLGYSVLDTLSYIQAQMDGNTAIITKAADIAAQKGIIVVNSAGNEGNGAWRMVIAPADGDSVIAVGAVTPYLERASFSSQGNTADGRIKPDVMALGRSTYIIELGGDIARGNGTSFSCPVLSGMMACVRQARPNIPAWELRNLLLASADRYAKPDSLYGYGIPNAAKMLAATFPSLASFTLFPNPSTSGNLSIFLNSTKNFQGKIEIFDLQGKRLFEQNLFVSDKNIYTFKPQLTSGLYFVRLLNTETNRVEEVQRLIVAQ